MKSLSSYLLLVVILLSSCSDHPTTITFPDGLEEIQLGSNSESLCLDCPNKLVGYIDLSQRNPYFMKVNPDLWRDLHDNYPELEVIWVFAGENDKMNKQKLVEFLIEFDYPFSVLYDRQNSFFEHNKLVNVSFENIWIQSYFVRGEDIILSAEPGISELFQEQLDDFLELE
ncbi:hypothetical protein SAMN04489724_1600 [Algoriphagus locisalis]|uniref:Redoxin domain-containing protein n=1 Tax=Algoriphagus locisalis TaxID=305507 RepID=A0A1I7A0R2_9BACT|nr:hypothetical protein [Algoriphagus locisalis]SFT68510.1 hypothetical protein SAMN04489724_1600 [Algoriphagus locisalis]